MTLNDVVIWGFYLCHWKNMNKEKGKGLLRKTKKKTKEKSLFETNLWDYGYVI